MKADVKPSAEKEALEWAIEFFREHSEDLKPHGETALDFAVAERIWHNDPKALEEYINRRVLSVLAYTGPKAAEVRRHHGKPKWNVASSARGLCMYAALLMHRGAPLPDSLRDFVVRLLTNPDVFMKKVLLARS